MKGTTTSWVCGKMAYGVLVQHSDDIINTDGGINLATNERYSTPATDRIRLGVSQTSGSPEDTREVYPLIDLL